MTSQRSSGWLLVTINPLTLCLTRGSDVDERLHWRHAEDNSCTVAAVNSANSSLAASSLAFTVTD